MNMLHLDLVNPADRKADRLFGVAKCVFHGHLATDSMSIWPAIP